MRKSEFHVLNSTTHYDEHGFLLDREVKPAYDSSENSRRSNLINLQPNRVTQK